MLASIVIESRITELCSELQFVSKGIQFAKISVYPQTNTTTVFLKKTRNIRYAN